MSENPIRTREITAVCKKHGAYTGMAETVRLFGAEREYMPYCPLCEKEHDAREQRKAAEEKTGLERQREQKAQQELKAMKIGKKFEKTDFENFDAYNGELREHLETCRRFAESPSGMLVMIGENGTGKTHLAVSMLKKTGGVIYTASEIGLKLRRSYGKNAEEKEWDIYDELCTVPLLVIDEAEKIKDTETKQNWMSHVVGKRYNEMLPVVFIANCHTRSGCTEPNPPCPKCLEYHLENDVISRINEDGIIMKFNSGDYREKKGKKGYE